MAHVLGTELTDVFLDEQVVSLVSLDGIAKVVLKNHFLWVSQVRA